MYLICELTEEQPLIPGWVQAFLCESGVISKKCKNKLEIGSESNIRGVLWHYVIKILFH